MRRTIIILITLLILTSCSQQREYNYPEIIRKPDERQSFWIVERDSLWEMISEQQVQIDSLNAYISYQDSLIGEYQLAMNEANQMVAIKQGFQIPDTITFAGVTFDLKNERIVDKFTQIYNQELKDANNYIPRSGRYFAYFDSVFNKYGVPEDAKYIAVAYQDNESAPSKIKVGKLLPRVYPRGRLSSNPNFHIGNIKWAQDNIEPSKALVLEGDYLREVVND